MITLSDHYLVATSTDYTPDGDIYGYHVWHVDIMPIYIVILIFIAFAVLKKTMISILKKIIKSTLPKKGQKTS